MNNLYKPRHNRIDDNSIEKLFQTITSTFDAVKLLNKKVNSIEKKLRHSRSYQCAVVADGLTPIDLSQDHIASSTYDVVYSTDPVDGLEEVPTHSIMTSLPHFQITTKTEYEGDYSGLKCINFGDVTEVENMSELDFPNFIHLEKRNTSKCTNDYPHPFPFKPIPGDDLPKFKPADLHDQDGDDLPKFKPADLHDQDGDDLPKFKPADLHDQDGDDLPKFKPAKSISICALDRLNKAPCKKCFCIPVVHPNDWLPYLNDWHQVAYSCNLGVGDGARVLRLERTLGGVVTEYEMWRKGENIVSFLWEDYGDEMFEMEIFDDISGERMIISKADCSVTFEQSCYR